MTKQELAAIGKLTARLAHKIADLDSEKARLDGAISVLSRLRQEASASAATDEARSSPSLVLRILRILGDGRASFKARDFDLDVPKRLAGTLGGLSHGEMLRRVGTKPSVYEITKIGKAYLKKLEDGQ